MPFIFQCKEWLNCHNRVFKCKPNFKSGAYQDKKWELKAASSPAEQQQSILSTDQCQGQGQEGKKFGGRRGKILRGFEPLTNPDCEFLLNRTLPLTDALTCTHAFAHPANMQENLRGRSRDWGSRYVGYALTTQWEGQPAEGLQMIGFDMGGTSTDVSRFAGSYEHVFESTTAGEPLIT